MLQHNEEEWKNKKLCGRRKRVRVGERKKVGTHAPGHIHWAVAQKWDFGTAICSDKHSAGRTKCSFSCCIRNLFDVCLCAELTITFYHCTLSHARTHAHAYRVRNQSSCISLTAKAFLCPRVGGKRKSINWSSRYKVVHCVCACMWSNVLLHSVVQVHKIFSPFRDMRLFLLFAFLPNKISNTNHSSKKWTPISPASHSRRS